MSDVSSYTNIIILECVCRCSQPTLATGRNSRSIILGDVSNCSYRLSLLPLTSSHLSSAWQFFYRRKHQTNLKHTHIGQYIWVRHVFHVFMCGNHGFWCYLPSWKRFNQNMYIYRAIQPKKGEGSLLSSAQSRFWWHLA